MDLIKQNLQVLGFSEEEIIIYLAALEEGCTTPLSLARNTGIPRTTVYLLIDSLVEKNILSLIEEGTKKSYSPASPEELIRIAQKKKIQLQETVLSLRQELPMLQALYGHTKNKPGIYYVSGEEEVLKVLHQISKEEKIYIQREICNVQSTFDIAFNQTIQEWERFLVPMRELIWGTSEEISEYTKSFASSRHEIRRVEQGGESAIYMIISDERVIYVIKKENHISAIILKDSTFTHFEHMRFHMIWDQATQD